MTTTKRPRRLGSSAWTPPSRSNGQSVTSPVIVLPLVQKVAIGGQGKVFVYNEKIPMVCFVKRLLLLATLLFVLTRFVDFSSRDFDPLRTQWNGSVDCITSSKYYGDYIQPIHQKVNPVVTEFHDYVTPSFNRLNAAAVDKYQVYLSKYVGMACDKITASPVHRFWLSLRPLVLRTTGKAHEFFLTAREVATRHLATSLLKLNAFVKVATAQARVHACAVQTQAVEKYFALKPRVIAYYKETVVPGAYRAYGVILEGSYSAWEHTKACTGLAFKKVKAIYFTHVPPLLEKLVFVHVRAVYAKYLKTYVDRVVFFLTKYYNLLRLNHALNISKRLATSSYQQAAIYFKQASSETVTSEIIEATTALEEDLPTETDTFADAVPTPVVTEDDAIDEDKTAEPVNAEAIIAESTAEAEPADEEEHEHEAEESVELDTKLSQDYGNEIVVTLAEEISGWRAFIYESVDNIFSSFDNSIAELENARVAEFKPKLSAALQDMTSAAQLDYAVINKAIFNVESKTVLLENGETAEVDRNGNIIHHKISRQEFRDLLAEKNAILKEKADGVNALLKSFVSDLEVSIDEERSTIVDVYEEFAEVAINEFSKKMMYSTLSSSFEKLQDKDDESIHDWKEYVKIKKDIIAKRDALTQKASELPLTNEMLKEIRNTLRTLEHENGSYYAILRAQANLAFQSREKAEREEAKRVEEDEDYTITTTVVKFATINADGEIETDQVDIGVVSDEEISDVESDDGDFVVVDPSEETGTVPEPEEQNTPILEETDLSTEEDADSVESPEPVATPEPAPEVVVQEGYVVGSPVGITIEAPAQ